MNDLVSQTKEYFYILILSIPSIFYSINYFFFFFFLFIIFLFLLFLWWLNNHHNQKLNYCVKNVEKRVLSKNAIWYHNKGIFLYSTLNTTFNRFLLKILFPFFSEILKMLKILWYFPSNSQLKITRNRSWL